MTSSISQHTTMAPASSKMSGSIIFISLVQLNCTTVPLEAFLCAFLKSSCWLVDGRVLHCATPGTKRLYRNMVTGVAARTCHLGPLLTTAPLILWKTLTWNNVSWDDKVFNGLCDTFKEILPVAKSALYRIIMLELFKTQVWGSACNNTEKWAANWLSKVSLLVQRH